MNDPHDNAISDRAVLLELMARAWRNALPVTTFSDEKIRDRCARLHAGLPPVIDADRAALAILRPAADDSEPVTDEDRAAMATCPTCGGAREVLDEGEGAYKGIDRAIPCPDCAGGKADR